MKVSPDATCVKNVVRDARTFKDALFDGTKVYKSGDQETLHSLKRSRPGPLFGI